MTTATLDRKRNPKRDYTMEEIEHGLTVFAANSRSRKRTAEQLSREGIDTPPSTVRAWADRKYKDVFKRIDSEIAELRRERHRASYEGTVDTATELQGDFLAELKRRMDDETLRVQIKDKDLIDGSQKLGLVAATATDKARLLAGESTANVKHDFEGTLRVLHDLGIGPGEFDFDGTATEEPEPALGAGDA